MKTFVNFDFFFNLSFISQILCLQLLSVWQQREQIVVQKADLLLLFCTSDLPVICRDVTKDALSWSRQGQ